MLVKSNLIKKNPLSKAQKKLLGDSLRRLLGTGLIEEPPKKPEDIKEMVIRNALNAIVLNS